MPWGCECRSRLVKQVTPKPVEKRPTKWDDFQLPGPSHYEPPQIYCGKGFSKIKRAPAYSFGYNTPIWIGKPAALCSAPMFNIQGLTRKGSHRITHSIIRRQYGVPGDKTQKPGPGTHAPKELAQIKRPPAYSLRIAAKPPYQPWDQWTPSPNMYLPPIPSKKPPAYSFGGIAKHLKSPDVPGPGEHDPNFKFVKKTKPAFSFGTKYNPVRGYKTPAPNAYCEKKFMYSKPFTPAPSFGIRHSPYLGKDDFYLKPSKLEILARDIS